jgi:hypothetical protein
MDWDIQNILRDVLECQGQERQWAVDAFFLLTEEYSIPSDVQDKIYDFFIKVPTYGITAWMIAATIADKLERAFGKSDYRQFLEELAFVLDPEIRTLVRKDGNQDI